ncbi:hypothetical protein GOP47_0010695 [Adiantum capillus-veneris]|uniref:Uncharacterized protein n=1 Tax=Adiantum capillus-veneris TaxID=13818 RepID=A0A9D4UVE2_ADICA|nr:hypothetical protein GOP47_0010695 [Adiantum capillus-veneris]
MWLGAGSLNVLYPSSGPGHLAKVTKWASSASCDMEVWTDRSAISRLTFWVTSQSGRRPGVTWVSSSQPSPPDSRSPVEHQKSRCMVVEA